MNKFHMTGLASVILLLFAPLAVYAQDSIKIDGTDYSISYTMTNGTILGIMMDKQATSLVISTDTKGDGTLSITLPRNLIDSKINGQDDQYFTLEDGLYVDVTEKKTATERTLNIAFPYGTEEIEIIGTQIVPEFGQLPILIITASIVGVIVLSRFRTSF